MLPLLLAILACGDDDAATGDDTGTTAAQTDARQPPSYSGATCPELEEGTQEFATGDTEYDVKIVLPDDPEGAPVLFAWHWLGGSAADIVRWMDLDDLAEDEGVIVIAPDSDGSTYEWHVLQEPEGNPDLLLFEDLLACASAQYSVDLDRVYAMGMSAGGLMTTYLTMYEAQWLASTAVFSGGTLSGAYDTPDRPLPVLVTWGGPTDTYSGFSFEDSSGYFSKSLQGDGSFVVECEHDLGHDIPDEATDYAWRFFSDHPYVLAEEPYIDGVLPDAFPSWCGIP